MSDWLTTDQVHRLTKKRQAAAQCRVLAQMGVPFTVTATGEPLVDAARYFTESKPAKKAGPNWSAIPNGKAA